MEKIVSLTLTESTPIFYVCWVNHKISEAAIGLDFQLADSEKALSIQVVYSGKNTLGISTVQVRVKDVGIDGERSQAPM